MLRQIIKIDKEKCNGCGLCVTACHEGAIGLIDGKAELLRDDYCDGLGNCLPVCPTGAITFEEREALPFDEEAVKKNMAQAEQADLPCGCPGSNAKAIRREEKPPATQDASPAETAPAVMSQLRQWPVQIKLVPVNAPYFEQANLLIAADCTAYAYGNFHQDFMKNKITLIGCPKLDEGDYSEKLAAILKANNIKSVTVVRMEVPCCRGIENAVVTALQNCGKMIPWQIKVLSTDGQILD
ncbi:MAG: 4Fe-4S binding protein [Clostridia bacterium]|jgi:ferredoxin|nr:4Fe-4S binding protein [Clostridia bacterium]